MARGKRPRPPDPPLRCPPPLGRVRLPRRSTHPMARETAGCTLAGRKPLLQGIFSHEALNAILASAENAVSQLRRSLGAFQLTLLGIGAIIGAGIFSTVGTAAAGGGGPARGGPGDPPLLR